MLDICIKHLAWVCVHTIWFVLTAESPSPFLWQDPLAIIGLIAIFFPFVLLGLAFASGLVIMPN